MYTYIFCIFIVYMCVYKTDAPPIIPDSAQAVLTFAPPPPPPPHRHACSPVRAGADAHTHTCPHTPPPQRAPSGEAQRREFERVWFSLSVFR